MLSVGVRRAPNQSPNLAALRKSLIWSDEFDGSADSAIDATNWVFDTGRGASGWGNNELEYYTNSTHNVCLDGNSNLSITVYHETTPDSISPSTPVDTAYTSARIKTYGLREFTPPCKVEARIKSPYSMGVWPAFWMLGHSSTAGYTTWPAEGEIDIAEWFTGGVKYTPGTLHVGKIGQLGTNISMTPTFTSYTEPGKFRTYGVDWYTDHMDFHLDGAITTSWTQAQTTAATGDWTPFGGGWPFYILLNLAIQYNTPTASSVFPQTMLVDWVRVWNI